MNRVANSTDSDSSNNRGSNKSKGTNKTKDFTRKTKHKDQYELYPSQARSRNKDETSITQMCNFVKLYANVDGYCVADGEKHRGYLIVSEKMHHLFAIINGMKQEQKHVNIPRQVWLIVKKMSPHSLI